MTEKPYNQSELHPLIAGPPIPRDMDPGATQMSAQVMLHTRQAVNLFRGRLGRPGVYPIIGAIQFGSLIAHIWSEAARDNPYADYMLIKVEEAHDKAQKTIDDSRQTIDDLLEGMDDFSINIERSVKPVEVSLSFHSPWGYRGMALLKQHDDLVLKAMTAKHVGLLFEDDWQATVYESATALRHLYMQPASYVSTFITRHELATNDHKAIRAFKKAYAAANKHWIELPEDVLNATRRAKLSPKIVPPNPKRGEYAMKKINEMKKRRLAAERQAKKAASKKTSISE